MAPETSNQPDHSPLTDPKILLADNESRLAKKLLHKYYEAKEKGTLTQVLGCSDARANAGDFMSDPIIEFEASIAAAGDKTFMTRTVIHPGVQQILTIQHFDGSTISKDKPPKGCGGLGVKEERVNTNAHPAEKGILAYVDRRIHHPGIYNQSISSAVEVAKHTDKPVLAGAMDHLTGVIHPFALITNHGRNIDASVPMDQFNDPSYIYRNGIPDLLDTEIPESFLRVLRSNRRRVAQLARLHPDIDRTQKIQDPPAIVITTALLPTSIRYPSTFGEPNTNFDISMPYVKSNGRVMGLHEQGLEEVLAQLEYPIGNAIQAQTGHGGHGFHKTNRLIIETPDLQLSRKVGSIVRSEAWMKPWLHIPGNQIWITQVISGHTTAAEALR